MMILSPSRVWILALASLPAVCGCQGVPETTEPMAFPADLLDGRTLGGWRKIGFDRTPEPRIEDGALLLPAGDPMTGVVWSRDFPADNYEITLEARRVSGGDFFCGLTFPVRGSAASLILGGWGGGVCGISSLDGMDASTNETTTYRQFETGRWYRVRLRVTPPGIEAWLDDEKIVDVETEGKKIDVRYEVIPSKPLGLSTWRTAGAIRNMRVASPVALE